MASFQETIYLILNWITIDKQIHVSTSQKYVDLHSFVGLGY